MDFFFNFLFLSTLAASTLVVFSKHPIHSVLSLILVFCLSSLVILLLTVDFFGLLLIVVYVGAIAVLFLFVIMMLNIKISQITESLLRWVPLVLLLIVVLVAEVSYALGSVLTMGFSSHSYSWETLFFGGSNIKLIGEVLYNYTFFSFLVAGLVLLTSLVGSILLTVGLRRSSKRQQIYKQVGRKSFGSINFYK